MKKDEVKKILEQYLKQKGAILIIRPDREIGVISEEQNKDFKNLVFAREKVVKKGHYYEETYSIDEVVDLVFGSGFKFTKDSKNLTSRWTEQDLKNGTIYSVYDWPKDAN